MTSYKPIYLPEAPSPKTIPLWVRVSTYTFGGNTDMYSITFLGDPNYANVLCSATDFFFLINLFIYFGCAGSSFLCEGFLQLWQARATVHRGARASHYRGLLLWNTGSRCTGSVVVVHRPSCSAACGIFPDQGSNPCPLNWQADSQPLRHQGSPCN